MHGAEAVAGHALSFSSGARFAQPALVNGAAGVAIVTRRRIIGALGFTFRGDKIAEIEVISDPEVLDQVNLALDS